VTTADLIFTQAALKIVRDAVSARPNHSVFGLLLGDTHEDPTCARPWVRVTGVHCGPSLSGDPSATSLGGVLEGLRAGLDDSVAGSIVGWYRSHPGAGLYLAPEEARFHEAQFADPWGFAMILVGDTGRLTGSVFQRTDPEGLSRSVYTPFYELVDGTSEFNGTTKRTFIDWANYQTETRVVQAGQGSVSDQISESEALVEAVPVVAPAPIQAAPAAAETKTPEVVAERAEREEGTKSDLPYLFEDNTELDWEKKQIQRSLTAVGRSIGTVSPGDFATQVPVDLADKTKPPAETGGTANDENKSAATREGASNDEATAGSKTRYPYEDRSVIPIRPRSKGSSSSEPGMVGRSRRTRTLPVKAIASAAAGVTLLAAAGWFGSRLMGSEVAALDGDRESRNSAVAGLSLAPTDLFRDDREANASEEELPADTSDRVPDAGLSVTTPTSELVEMRRPTAADLELSRLDDVLRLDVGLSEPAAEEPRRRPRQPRIAEAPELAGVELADPQVSAFLNALGIQRQEAQRYEGIRTAFDEGTETCNPLNLAVRGAQDSYERLQRRFQSAAEQIDAENVRAFESAKRQTAMIEAHYGLTGCPTSPS